MGLPPGEAGPGSPGMEAGPGPEAGSSPEGAPGPAGPGTGDERVDQALSRLKDLDGLPVTEHPAVFEYVHEQLAEALGDLDVGGHAAR